MHSAWEQIERRWPAVIGASRPAYADLHRDVQSWLCARGVVPLGFSHVGIVAADRADALAALAQFAGCRLDELRTDWVASFGVYVGRRNVGDTELEFIVPVNESFFRSFLRDHGEGLQHLSFRVGDIEECLARLQATGVPLVDSGPREGSHGKIAFARPEEFAPLCLELCQPGHT